jgi:hypothetical protein
LFGSGAGTVIIRPLRIDVDGITEQDAGARGSLSQVTGDLGWEDHAAHRHEGNFAVGQELTEHHAELLDQKGSFASGVALKLQAHQGTFAEGQEHEDPHPEVLENRGGFAAGQRKDARLRQGRGSLPSFA